MPARFADLLKTYEKQQGYNPRQVSELTGIPVQTIYKWRRGETQPSSEIDVLKLATSFKLARPAADELLQAAGHLTLADLRQKAEQVTTKQRDELISLLESWLPESALAPFGDHPEPEAPSLTELRSRPAKIRLPLAVTAIVLLSIILAAFIYLNVHSFDPTACKLDLDRPNCMILIPAGAFQMGSDADVALAECEKYAPQAGCQRSWFENEEPIHTVELDGFYIDRYEVTNAQYAKCMATGVCQPPAHFGSDTRLSYYGNPKYDSYPVIWVNWQQAQTYCQWRGARLPTEAEWEKAARGTEGRLYPWGDTFDGNRVNFCDSNCKSDLSNQSYDDGYAETAPVGSYPRGVSPYGVYDLAGNVWEWVADEYTPSYASASPTPEPSEPPETRFRVLRGGGWNVSGGSVRTSHRLQGDPQASFYDVGFRCARSKTTG